MLNSLLQGGLKFFAYFVVWVFVLSIQWNGRTLFDRSHEILVDNAVVAGLDAELKDVWDGFTSRLQTAFNEEAETKASESETY